MVPDAGDFLYGKFRHDRDPGEIQLLRRGDMLIARKRDERAVIYQKWSVESVAFARDVLGLLGWKEQACLREFTEAGDEFPIGGAG